MTIPVARSDGAVGNCALHEQLPTAKDTTASLAIITPFITP